MRTQLASPRRIAIAAIPGAAFLITPFLPFVNTDSLWFGVPSVLVWTFGCVLLTVVAMNLVEFSYRRDGGLETDAAEMELEAALSAANREATR
ncbi:hypothetical protein ACWDTI_23605 [Gordonia sp. NPDC003424]